MRRFFAKLFASLAVFLVVSWLALARPFVFIVGAARAVPTADPQNLKLHTAKISNEFSPRDWQHVDNLNRTADYLFQEFSRTSARVSRQTYSLADRKYSNIISEYGSPSEKGTVVIGAHYDACGEYPGADDNASGAAGLLELGRLLSKQELSFKVLLVGYTLEEPPLFATSYMGSAVHADSLRETGEKVQLMISLEMIGYFSDAPTSQSYPMPLLNFLYPSRGDFLAIVGNFSLSSATLDLKRAFLKSVALPVLSINAPAVLPGIDFSDHRNYWKNGFEAVMISDTAFFRNKAYHTEGDTADRLNYEKMAQVVTGVNSYLVGLDEEPQK